MKLKIEFGFGVRYRGDGSAILGHEQDLGMEEIFLRAVELFGGYTKFNTVFAWKDPGSKYIMNEKGCTISVYTHDNVNVEKLIDVMVQQIKRSLEQAAVGVTRTEVEFDII